MGWYIFWGIVALIIAGLFAGKFGQIADEKGYNGTAYGWLCFFFGVIGACVVAALPDQMLHAKIDNLYARVATDGENKKVQNPADPAEMPIVMTTGGWRCSCGREHPAYESSCICGTSKRDALRNKE